jgi:carbon-monoxide dehydrogenase large subunit
MSAGGPGSSTRAPSTAMGGVYVIPAIFMDTRGVFTNTIQIDAYRGAGKPEANYVIERLMDLAARKLGLDPTELRRRNFITEFPYRMPLGSTIDCGNFAGNVDAAVVAADRAGFAARREAAARRGKLRGLGIACFLETSRGAPNEGAEVRFEKDGRVAILLGTQSNGQGHETSFPQIAADLTGLPLESFRYEQADTDTVRAGAGHGGARSLHMGGSAMVKAIEGAIEKGRGVAARLLQASAGEMAFANGKYAVRGTDRSVGLLEVARAAVEEDAAGLDTYVFNIADLITFPNGCHIAEVEIDPDTGAVVLERYIAVDDFGTLINPMLTVGQVQGGVAQGIGQALLEHTVYDPESGQLLTGSLMDYALPRAGDLSPLEITFREVPTGNNPLGVKGSGQAGCIAAPPTIMNAVMDALAPLGIRHLDMPATPDRVWRAIQEARR